jgi:hypothetical protein
MSTNVSWQRLPLGSPDYYRIRRQELVARFKRLKDDERTPITELTHKEALAELEELEAGSRRVWGVHRYCAAAAESFAATNPRLADELRDIEDSRLRRMVHGLVDR